MNIHLILVIAFIICEALAAIGVVSPRINLEALGLAFFGASLLV